MSAKKLTRHDLKKPDEFVSFATHAFEWMQQNVKAVFAIVAVVLLVAVGLLAFVQYNRGQNDKAMYDYGRATDALHKAMALTGKEREKGVADASAKLQQVFENYRNTRAADFALLSVG